MALELVCERFRSDVEYSVVTVVPSLWVLVVSEGVALNFGDPGRTLTGSDAPEPDPCSVFGATSLGVLYVVVTVVPSLVVVLLPFGKGSPSGKSSMGMMFTGSDARKISRSSALGVCRSSVREG